MQKGSGIIEKILSKIGKNLLILAKSEYAKGKKIQKGKGKKKKCCKKCKRK